MPIETDKSASALTARRGGFLGLPIARVLPYTVDAAVMLLAFVTAYALRFNFNVPSQHWQSGQPAFLVTLLLQYGALMALGCHRVAWRYITAGDVPRFIAAISASTFVSVALRFVLPRMPMVRPPFSIALINGVLTIGGLLLVRVLWRLILEDRRGAAPAGRPPRRVLLVGAGSVGIAVARELRQHEGGSCEIIGFLDDDPAKQGTVIQGVHVRGTLDDLPDVVRALTADEVIVAIVGAPRDRIRRIVHDCENLRVNVRIAPGYYEILDGSVSVSRLREVEIADLLGRPEIALHDSSALARFVGGRRVLVTGAGGSIGSELARQVLRAGPSALVLVERCESALFIVDHELRATARREGLRAQVADIADETRMRGILAASRPEIVLHAAAHKHVPLMESNVCEAIANNVLATRRLGELALEYGVEVFVLLSTDKAVHPSSVMGATKRVSEQALQALNRLGGTRFAAVRFGNVLGASGSVVPIFREQIRRGGPVTVTHPDMRRYFMTIPEAVHLVLQAAAMAAGGEIFILDMGEPMRVVELAEEMIRLSGLQPYSDVPIVYTGPRPGEKLFEELSTAEEQAARTRHPRIFTGRIAMGEAGATAATLQRLAAAIATGDDARARAVLMEAVGGENGKVKP